MVEADVEKIVKAVHSLTTTQGAAFGKSTTDILFLKEFAQLLRDELTRGLDDD